MYYLNSFLLYSVLGFLMESTVYKITASSRHSGMFYGPITIVYGIGALVLLLLNKYIFNKINNKYIKIITILILSAIFLTIVEYTCGNLIKYIFNIDMWDYSNKKYNFGKYICLELSLIWGIFGILFVYIIKPFIDKFIKKIPIVSTYIFTIIFLTDLTLILIFK